MYVYVWNYIFFFMYVSWIIRTLYGQVLVCQVIQQKELETHVDIDLEPGADFLFGRFQVEWNVVGTTVLEVSFRVKPQSPIIKRNQLERRSHINFSFLLLDFQVTLFRTFFFLLLISYISKSTTKTNHEIRNSSRQIEEENNSNN